MSTTSPALIAPERLALHSLWLESNNRRGERLVLEGDLRDVKLDGADLRGGLIRGDLRGAHLSGARLNGADLKDAMLWDADLSSADLTDATGLLPSAERGGISPLSGADLRGAKLPEDVAKFPALDNVAELSKNAGALFLSLITGDAFIQLIVAKATDLQLLTDSGSTTIPFVNADIPITTLFWLAPLLLLINYIALHLYLQRLWELMSNLPAVFPDGLLLTQKSYPWLPNDLVRRGFPRLASRDQALAMSQKWLFTFLIYAVVPLSLFPIWAKYLKVHSWPMTNWHILCGALFLWYAWAFYAVATATLARNDRLLVKWRSRVSVRTVWDKATVLLPPAFVSLLFAAFSYTMCLNAITWGIPREYWFHDRPELSEFALRRWVPRVLDEIGYSPFANLRETEVSQKPDKWEGKPSDDVDSVRTRAKLSGQNLRYADLTGAFVVHGDLRNAVLTHARLTSTDLRGSTCEGTQFEDAFLEHAELTGADLTRANLTGTHLKGAGLTGTHLTGADLTGVNLSHANLTRANLAEAALSEAYLTGVNLSHANLTRANLQGATLYEADLTRANLQGADLREADLREADLSGADLSEAEEHVTGADLPDNYFDTIRANLSNADLTGANLTGANLTGANLTGANLTGANLTGANLTGANPSDTVPDEQGED